MRDSQRKNPRYYRKEEWVAFGVDPTKVDSLAQQMRGRIFICAILEVGEPDEPVRMEYKRLGYRLLRTEPLFVHDLKRVRRLKSPVQHCPGKDARDGRTLWKGDAGAANSTRMFHRARAFSAVRSDRRPFHRWLGAKCQCRSSAWCSNMYVVPSHRRRGIGSCMLAKMLRDDRTRGMNNSVLLSSHTGASCIRR